MKLGMEVGLGSGHVVLGRHLVLPVVDLGMFSMFGRTGAPTKRGPHKKTCKLLQQSNMPEIIEIIIIRKRFCVVRWCHKVSILLP